MPTDTDLERGKNLMCDMLLYNVKTYSNKAIETAVGCKVRDVDFSQATTGGPIACRIMGDYNAYQAIINAKNGANGKISIWLNFMPLTSPQKWMFSSNNRVTPSRR